MKYWAALVLALSLNATANLLMKMGMNTVQEAGGLFRGGAVSAVKAVLTSTTLMIGLFCFAANAALYMFALQSKTLKISLAYPIMVGGGFALIALVARFHPMLAERLTWGQWVGVAMVLAGVVVIATQAQATPT